MEEKKKRRERFWVNKRESERRAPLAASVCPPTCMLCADGCCHDLGSGGVILHGARVGVAHREGADGADQAPHRPHLPTIEALRLDWLLIASSCFAQQQRHEARRSFASPLQQLSLL